jgi:hypothetical protein
MQGVELKRQTSFQPASTRLSGGIAIPTVKSIPAGVQAVFPMLVCQSPEAEMNFCASVFGAVEQVRRAGADGSPIHIAMRISDAFLVVQSEFPDVVASRTVAARLEETTEEQRAKRWEDIREGHEEG